MSLVTIRKHIGILTIEFAEIHLRRKIISALLHTIQHPHVEAGAAPEVTNF